MKNYVMSVSALLLCAGLGAGEPIDEIQLPPVAVWPADLEYDPSLIDLTEPETPEWVERLKNNRGQPDCDLLGDPNSFDYVVRLTTWPGLVPNRIVYIDASAPLGGDGSNWSSAYQSLHDALNAENFDTELVDIRIAQGLYRADRVNGVDTLDSELTYEFPGITVTDGVPTGVMRIAGGFAGRSAKDPDQRDPDLFPTVFTGDLLGNDTDDHENYEDNTKVMFEPGLTELNGITIEHGRVAVYEGRWITDCTVRWCFAAGDDLPITRQERSPIYVHEARVVGMTALRNRAEQYGGAVNASGFNVVANSRFCQNTAPGGGAIGSRFAQFVVQNSLFTRNRSEATNGGLGGAVMTLAPGVDAAQVVYSTFVGNESIDGLCAAVGGNASVTSFNSVFNQNYSATGGHVESDIFLFELRGSSLTAIVEANVFSIYNSNLDEVNSDDGNRFRLNGSAHQPFVAVAGPDGELGTVDDDPSLRQSSPAIGRSVLPPAFAEAAIFEIGLFDIADLDADCNRTEPIPIDLLGNPRAVESLPEEGLDGYAADAGCIELVPSGEPEEVDPWVYVDPQIVDFSMEPIRLFVNAAASPGGDGFSWNSAYQNPGEALEVAAARFGPTEIWVAQGTYVAPVTRSEIRAFRMLDNVTMLGGFVGDETEAGQRDWVANPTTLTGDTLGNDLPGDRESWTDNALQVVLSIGARGGGVLDGFTIESGTPRALVYGPGVTFSIGFFQYGENEGGLSRIVSGQLRLRNCRLGPDATGSLLGRPFVTLDGANSTLAFDDSVITFDRGNTGTTFDFYPIGVDRSVIQVGARAGQGDVVLRNCHADLGFFGGLIEQIDGGDITLDRCMIVTRYSESFLAEPTVRSFTSGEINLRGSMLVGETVSAVSIFSNSGYPLHVENTTMFGNQVVVYANPNGPNRDLRIVNSVLASTNGFPSFLESRPGDTIVGNALAEVDSPLENVDPTNSYFNFANNTAQFFLDPLGPDGAPYTGDEDLRLATGSPAMNTGLNAFVDSEFDLDGNERIIGTVVDRGAYEFTGTCTGDVNGDGAVDLGDLNLVLANFGQPLPFGDASGDGVVDLADLNIVLAAFGTVCD